MDETCRLSDIDVDILVEYIHSILSCGRLIAVSAYSRCLGADAGGLLAGP